MSVLVDEAIWRWRGRRWAHLVSDADIDELHRFARHLGVPYLAFQGDHYDVHDALRLRAIAAGARPVSGRELVVALRAAGLRRRVGPGPWQWQWRRHVVAPPVGPGPDPNRFPEPILELILAEINRLAVAGTPAAVGRAERHGEALLVVSTSRRIEIDSGVTRLDAGEVLHRSSGERGTFVELVSGRTGVGPPDAQASEASSVRAASIPTRSRSSA